MNRMRSSPITVGLAVIAFVLLCFYTNGKTAAPPPDSERRADDGGIKEVIPAKYLGRYLAWKNDFLSTEAGREQWRLFETNPQFTLTITISSDNAEGASTGKYRWNQAGKL